MGVLGYTQKAASAYLPASPTHYLLDTMCTSTVLFQYLEIFVDLLFYLCLEEVMLHADEEYKDTNQTKVTSLSEKVEVLGKSNRGMNTTATRYYSVND
jgi:hypothetical protein